MPSPSGGAPAKTCSICGIDVSGKPRTKDAKGHYYCNPCFGTALARRKAAEAGASTPSKGSGRNAPAHNLDADDGLSLLSELIDGGPEAPPIATPTVSCPQCGAMTSPGSVICVHCGYNFSTNTVGGKTKIAKAPRRSGGGGNIWPMVVGILCLAFGGLNVLAGVIFMIIMLMNGQIAGLGQAVGILISMLLVTGGVRIIQHNRRGVFLVRLYAGIMLFFCTCIFVGVRAIPS
ncbi:MAG TPA: zinc ribbon domain-containing protein, partial [Phycisphaerales bacterium]|nr:zinc ribbon domain-containing protein [Phycisphaerales bacterium]